MVHHQFLMWHLLIDPILPHSCVAVIDQLHPFFPTPVAAVLLKHSTALCGLGINSMATMLQLNNVVFYLPSSHFDHFLNNDRFSWQHLPLYQEEQERHWDQEKQPPTSHTHIILLLKQLIPPVTFYMNDWIRWSICCWDIYHILPKQNFWKIFTLLSHAIDLEWVTTH